MKTVSVKVASAVIAGLGLAAGAIGMASAQTTGEIGNTGESSDNLVRVVNNEAYGVEKNNDVDVTNNNPQSASSGDSKVTDGEDNGVAESGSAVNGSQLDGSVTVDQTGTSANVGSSASSGAQGSITGTTGEDSSNEVRVENNVASASQSNSTVNVVNNNTQSAHSGNATVQGGDDGGSATSGNAANASNTTFTVSVKQ